MLLQEERIIVDQMKKITTKEKEILPSLKNQKVTSKTENVKKKNVKKYSKDNIA